MSQQEQRSAVVYEALTPAKLKDIRLLNSVLFPVKFHVRFRAVAPPWRVAAFAFLPLCGAGIWCNRSPPPHQSHTQTLQDQVYKDALACGDVTQLGGGF
jgi:hypothetical protein